MTISSRTMTGFLASGVGLLGLFCAASVTHAAPVVNEVMLVNAKTGKCATIAGGTVSDNNHPSVQFECDSHPSRRWRLNEIGGNNYEIRNVKTGKCLTIAGGESTENNVPAVQFDCDGDPSRIWMINDVTGSGFFQIRNLQTEKCLTISGGESDANNLETLQFNCDTDLSRRWTIRLKL